MHTEAQHDKLVRLGCDEMQGFLFAKLITAALLAMWAEGDATQAALMFRDSLFVDMPPAPPAL